jgi:hypothetical protein
MKTWLAFSIAVLVTGSLVWSRSSAVVGAAQGSAAVQIIPGGQKQAGNPGEKGATYYALETQTKRLTTKFKDGHTAVAERGLVGEVETRLHDQAGNERARLRLNRIDGSHDTVSYEPIGGTAFQMLSDPNMVKPTLDWATRQAYGFERDGTANLVWDGGSMRPKASARRDVESDVDEVETVWANGIVARLTRQTYSRRQIAKGRFVQGPVLVSELTQYGVPAGTAVWFERDHVFAYTLPGLLSGVVVIGPEELKANYGGWPFTPDTTWLNLQLIAAHQFKTQAVKDGSVAGNCSSSKPNRLVQFFMPTVNANEPGCDGLHWLDGSVVRECCDNHDLCYAKAGCSSSSWWQVWSSWSCDVCNLTVVVCFIADSSMDYGCINKQGCAY